MATWMILLILLAPVALSLMATALLLPQASRVRPISATLVAWLLWMAAMEVTRGVLMWTAHGGGHLPWAKPYAMELAFIAAAGSMGLLLPSAWQWHARRWVNWTAMGMGVCAVFGVVSTWMSLPHGIAVLDASMAWVFAASLSADPLPWTRSARGRLACAWVCCFGAGAVGYPLLGKLTHPSSLTAQLTWVIHSALVCLGLGLIVHLAMLLRQGRVMEAGSIPPEHHTAHPSLRLRLLPPCSLDPAQATKARHRVLWRNRIQPWIQGLRHRWPMCFDLRFLTLTRKPSTPFPMDQPHPLALQQVELHALLGQISRNRPVDSIWDRSQVWVWADPQRLSDTLTWALDELLNLASRATVMVDCGPEITLTMWPVEITGIGAKRLRLLLPPTPQPDSRQDNERAQAQAHWLERQGGHLLTACFDDMVPTVKLTLRPAEEP